MPPSSPQPVTGDPFFPYDFPIGALPKDYMALKKAVTELIDGSNEVVGHGYSLTLKRRKTRDYGEQSLPLQNLYRNRNRLS